MSRGGLAAGGVTLAAAVLVTGIMIGQGSVVGTASAPAPAVTAVTHGRPADRPVRPAAPTAVHTVVTVDPSAIDAPAPGSGPIGPLAWVCVAVMVAAVVLLLVVKSRQGRRDAELVPEFGGLPPSRVDLGPLTHELPAGPSTDPGHARTIPSWISSGPTLARPRVGAVMADSTTVMISPRGGSRRTPT